MLSLRLQCTSVTSDGLSPVHPTPSFVQEADPGERREWLLLAAAALKAAGEEAAATEIARTLGPAPSRAAGGLRA